MVVALEPQSRGQGIRSSALRRPISLREGDSRILVDSDGSVVSFDSLIERRALFGREQVYLYKVQAGVVVQAQRQELSIRAVPRSVQFAGKAFEGIEVVQTIGFFHGSSTGYFRRVRLRNGSASAIKIRLLDIADPTGAQFGESPSRWGALGLNAFNRGSHVAMDEVSEPSSARVFGSQPGPSRIYMSTDKSRVLEFIRTGELPDSVAGTSGLVIIASLHDFELSPNDAKELVTVSICNPSKLEDSLADFGRIEEGTKPLTASGPTIATSSAQVGEAAAWAITQLEGAPGALIGLDAFETLAGLALVNPSAVSTAVARSRTAVSREGALPHSLDASRPGPLETAVFLQALSRNLLLCGDKKVVRSRYPLVKRLCSFLMSSSKDHALRLDPSLPQGWRRMIGTGFPAGQIPEVSLAAAGALASASQVAKRLAKSEDASKFRERAEMLAEGVRKTLVDERGFLALCLDPKGRLRDDETIDSAVAAFRHPFSDSTELATAHRMLEKDFETPFGPRTVPRSNGVYFNGTYGSGQLGGVWTRASLAHAILCYRLGLAGIGSLAVQKVARLVTEDIVRLGGTVGEFPLWVDVEGGSSHGGESDLVSAARFVEALVAGELGLTYSSDVVTIAPSGASALKWVLLSDVWLGDKSSVFVGRASGGASTFYAPSRMKSHEGVGFAKAEALEPPARGVVAESFYGPGQVICLGSSAPSPATGIVVFTPRAPELSTRLSTSLESYDAAKGTWNKVGSLRVLPKMTFEASLGPGEWKAFRVSSL